MTFSQPATIDNTQLGALLAYGGDFVVYHYGSNQVIKYSRFSLILGTKFRNKLINDYQLCAGYFRKYLVDTQVIQHSKQYIELQPLIDGSSLTYDQLSNPKIKQQLKEIIDITRQMINDGHSPIDLIGLSGIIKPCLANVFVDQDDNLCIIDATLFESTSVGLLGYFVTPVMWIARRIQNHKLNKLYQLLS